MATPQNISVENLNGKWILNKELSSETGPIFKLQNVPWVIRKAFDVATLYLQASQYITTGSESARELTKVDFYQTATGGLAGTKEQRTLNWEVCDHKDYFFGSVKHQSHFVYGIADADDVVRPHFELQFPRNKGKIKAFLRGEFDPDGSQSSGFLVENRNGEVTEVSTAVWIHTTERNIRSQWTAEQIWGFEMVEDVRRFSRRVVVMNDEGHFICGRLLYDFVGE